MSRLYGVVTGRVIDVKDPQGEGRVRLQFPWLPGQSEGYWAPVATLMSGKERGSWFMPEIEDEVLVAFEQGDVNHPYVIGFLWNGKDQPPSTDTQSRLLRSVNGHEIELYDPDVKQGDKGFIRFQDANGNKVLLANAQISIESLGVVTIKAPSVIINGRPVRPTPEPI
jgi:uncharacterized protein involved in type VI secretion and phage assembly